MLLKLCVLKVQGNYLFMYVICRRRLFQVVLASAVTCRRYCAAFLPGMDSYLYIDLNKKIFYLVFFDCIITQSQLGKWLKQYIWYKLRVGIACGGKLASYPLCCEYRTKQYNLLTVMHAFNIRQAPSLSIFHLKTHLWFLAWLRLDFIFYCFCAFNCFCY